MKSMNDFFLRWAFSLMLLWLVAPVSAQVVARVGDTEISVEEYEDRARSLRRSGYKHLQSMNMGAKQQLLDGIIAQELLVLEGYRQGVDDDPVIAADLARHERRALMNALYDTQALLGDYTSTEEELRAYYHEAQYDIEVNARHIVCATEEDAWTVVEGLQAGGSFDSLLSIYSLPRIRSRFGPSGWVGWFRTGSLFEDIIAPMNELAEGEYHPAPVKTELGYHVFLLEARRDRPFETSVDFARDKVRTQLRANDMEAYVNSLRERYEITIDQDALEIVSRIDQTVGMSDGSQTLVSWKDGHLSIADYMGIVEAGRAKHPSEVDLEDLSRSVDNHAGQHVMVAEARRLGLDQELSVRRQFEDRRRELFAKWLFVQETRRRVEADTSAASVRQFYEQNLDIYTREDGQVTDLTVVEGSIRASMLRYAESAAMDEFISELQDRYADQIVVDEVALSHTFPEGNLPPTRATPPEPTRSDLE